MSIQPANRSLNSDLAAKSHKAHAPLTRFVSISLLISMLCGCSAALHDKNYTLGQYNVTQVQMATRLLSTGSQKNLPIFMQCIGDGLSRQLPKRPGTPPVTMNVEITSLSEYTQTDTALNSKGEKTSDDVTTTKYRLEGLVRVLQPNSNHLIADAVVSVEDKIGRSYANSSFGETLTNNLLHGYTSKPDEPAMCNEFVSTTIKQFYPLK